MAANVHQGTMVRRGSSCDRVSEKELRSRAVASAMSKPARDGTRQWWHERQVHEGCDSTQLDLQRGAGRSSNLTAVSNRTHGCHHPTTPLARV
mmetsp:Transcript_92093/g.276351  ORF Transcript_92093/g.276351 Transcript_92093/m.276351 type:complete len:93 (+) Transcript_92093:866-1144(+)|eukprot:6334403-Prymnesium_polylepis.1